MWLESGGSMKLKDIAAALSVGETQIRKWKSQDGWAAELNSNVTIEIISNVTKRKGPPKGNKNAVGNRGEHRQGINVLSAIKAATVDRMGIRKP